MASSMDQSGIIVRGAMKEAGVEDFNILVLDKDMVNAAHILVQLSKEERSNSVDHGSNGQLKEEGVLPRFSSDATAKMIGELFGKDDEDDGIKVAEFKEASEPNKDRKNKKKRNYRSLEDLYRVTEPMDHETYFKKMMISYY